MQLADERDAAVERADDLELRLKEFQADAKAAAADANASVTSEATITASNGELTRLQAQVSAVETSLQALRAEERRLLSGLDEHRRDAAEQEEGWQQAAAQAADARKALAEVRSQQASQKARLERLMEAGRQTQERVQELQVGRWVGGRVAQGRPLALRSTHAGANRWPCVAFVCHRLNGTSWRRRCRSSSPLARPSCPPPTSTLVLAPTTALPAATVG